MVFEILTASIVHKIYTKKPFMQSLFFGAMAWVLGYIALKILLLLKLTFFAGFLGVLTLTLAVYLLGMYVDRFKTDKIVPITAWVLTVMGLIKIFGIALFLGFFSGFVSDGFIAIIKTMSLIS